jgi:hypothetical protein
VLINPFTARSGVDPKVFIGRQDELGFFINDAVGKLSQGRCSHYIVTGSWGVGKTILLKQMKLHAQELGYWALHFPLREFSATENPGDFAQHLLEMAASELPILPKQKREKITGLGGTILGCGLQFSFSDHTAHQKKDPHVFLRDGIIEIYEHSMFNKANGLVLLLDDVHNLPIETLFFTLLRNVLIDPRIADKLKLLVVLSSIDKAWNQFQDRDHPISRLFIPRRRIGKLSQHEVFSLIEKSTDGTGVFFDDEVSKSVYDYTKGHVFEVQAMCESLFDRQIKGRVTMDSWEASLQHTLLSLADVEFSMMIKRASSQEIDVLALLAKNSREMSPSEIKKILPRLSNPGVVLSRLVEKEIVESPRRGVYVIPDRLFAEYVIQMQVDNAN